MNVIKRMLIGIVAMLASVSTAQAADVAIGLKTSTLGLGAEIVTGLTPHLNLRGVVNGFEYSRNATHNTIDYNGKLNLFSAGAILDFMPAENGKFHVSLGGLYDGNKLDLTGTPTGGNYVINGVTYTAAQAGTVNGSVKFNKFAPYVGLGYGNALADSGWSVSFDAGALYQGTPKATLSATGAVAGLAANVAAEQIQLQNSVKNYKWWPVVALGLDYSF